MSRRNVPPQYPRRPHKSGQARIRIAGRDVWLGPFGSAKSHERYQQELALWRARREVDASAAASAPASGPIETVAQLAAAFLVHAKQHYRHADGTPTSELAEYKCSFAPLLRLYGRAPVVQFGPVALETVMRAMASGSWLTDEEKASRAAGGRGRVCSRKVANRRMARIRRAFKWGASKQLIPFAVYDALRTVTGIPAHRGQAIEHPDVLPVPEADLAATLPRLCRIVRAMVEFQMLTGARPGEIVGLRPCDLMRDARPEIGPGLRLDAPGVWVVRLDRHKTAHHGRARIILVGPKAQAVLAPFLDGRPSDKPLFSAEEAREEF